MNGAPTFDARPEDFSRNVVAFGTFLNAYRECSKEVQAIVDDMLEIVRDKASTEDECEHAIDVIADALLPGLMHDIREAHETVVDIECEIDEGKSLSQQEATFAERLVAIMEEKGLTQVDLAARAGVQQPAISMIIKRECRPQQRTIKKLADALGVSPDALWPPPA